MAKPWLLEVSGRAASKMTVGNVLAVDVDGVLYSIGGSGEGGVTGINGVQANPSMKEDILCGRSDHGQVHKRSQHHP